MRRVIIISNFMLLIITVTVTVVVLLILIEIFVVFLLIIILSAKLFIIFVIFANLIKSEFTELLVLIRLILLVWLALLLTVLAASDSINMIFTCMMKVIFVNLFARNSFDNRRLSTIFANILTCQWWNIEIAHVHHARLPLRFSSLVVDRLFRFLVLESCESCCYVRFRLVIAQILDFVQMTKILEIWLWQPVNKKQAQRQVFWLNI